MRRRLLGAVAVMAALGLIVELWHARSHDAAIEILVPRFSLSYEANVPTWFATVLLFGCALAAYGIARDVAAGGAGRRHWWAIAGIATYASLDEATELHEHLGGHLELGGALYFDWVIPAAAIVVALVLVFWPFVWALPARTRTRLMFAAAIYVVGAVGMDLPLGWWTDHAGPDNLGYALIDWVGETLELVGASLALLALVDHRAAAAAAAASEV